jgi:dolichol-phosphate mannosyltransferase
LDDTSAAGGARSAGSVWIILPTYDEVENVAAVTRAVLSALEPAVPRATVLIVDDASPDGTGEVADRLAAELDGVEVLHRAAKEGLGPAYQAGFARALAAGADLVVEMDADFSHDPAHLPALLAAARDADLVLGSRYVPGGGVRGWGPLRRVMSRGGSAYARLALGLGVRDLTGGFKAIRREVLEGIDLGSLRGQGYVFQIEVTQRAALAGFRIVEVPIVFSDRRLGYSKMSPRIAFEAAWLVPTLRWRNRRWPSVAAARRRGVG